MYVSDGMNTLISDFRFLKLLTWSKWSICTVKNYNFSLHCGACFLKKMEYWCSTQAFLKTQLFYPGKKTYYHPMVDNSISIAVWNVADTLLKPNVTLCSWYDLCWEVTNVFCRSALPTFIIWYQIFRWQSPNESMDSYFIRTGWESLTVTEFCFR